MAFEYVVGIDPGTDTGFAVRKADEDKLIDCQTVKIHYALSLIYNLFLISDNIFVFLEDAHLSYKPPDKITKQDIDKAQGVGSIKRDCSIWKEFLDHYRVPYKLVKPSGKNTKWPVPIWQKVTRWTKRTSHNARDAGVLAMMSPPNLPSVD